MIGDGRLNELPELDNLQLECEAKANPPVEEYKWYFNASNRYLEYIFTKRVKNCTQRESNPKGVFKLPSALYKTPESQHILKLETHFNTIKINYYNKLYRYCGHFTLTSDVLSSVRLYPPFLLSVNMFIRQYCCDSVVTFVVSCFCCIDFFDYFVFALLIFLYFEK